MLKIKRVYDVPQPGDGYRVLVDRLWPRGLSKSEAKVSLWLKDIAPSDALRKWFGHDPAKWPAFREKYRAELQAAEQPLAALQQLLAAKPTVTLLYAAHDPEHNNALVLGELLH